MGHLRDMPDLPKLGENFYRGANPPLREPVDGRGDHICRLAMGTDRYLEWHEGDRRFSPKFGDHYYGRAGCKHVFLAGNGLPAARIEPITVS